MTDRETRTLLNLHAEAAQVLAPLYRELSVKLASVMPRLQLNLDFGPVAEAIRNVAIPTEVAARMQQAVQTVAASLEPFTQQFADLARQYGDILPEFLLALREAQWPPPSDHSDVTLRDMARVVTRRREEGQEAARAELDALMLGRHGGEVIDALLVDWSDNLLLRGRAPILRAGVEAHLRGDYACSVPTLLPQIEGIVVDGYGHKGRLCGKDYRDYLKRLLEQDSSQGLEAELRDVARMFFLDILLAEFEHGKAIHFHPSRHAVLHGADVSYATEENSLKAILAVEALQDCLRLVGLQGSKVYHRAGCPRISRSSSKRTYFSHIADALDADKRPCRYCLPDERIRS
jgi:hypothetical protein